MTIKVLATQILMNFLCLIKLFENKEIKNAQKGQKLICYSITTQL